MAGSEGFFSVFGGGAEGLSPAPGFTAESRSGQFARMAAVSCGAFSARLNPALPEPVSRIIVVQQGRLNLTEGARTLTAGRGSALLVNDRGLSSLSSAGAASFLCLCLPNSYFFAQCGFRAAGFRSVLLEGSEPLLHSFMRMAGLAATLLPQLDGDDAQSLCEALLAILRRILARKLQSHPAIVGRHDELRFRAIAYLMEHYRDPQLTVQTLAESLGVSVRTVSGLFQETGQPVAERIAQMRLNEASVLLASRDRADSAIADIALACGYSSAQTFARAFKARYGMTPAAWRQEKSGCF